MASRAGEGPAPPWRPALDAAGPARRDAQLLQGVVALALAAEREGNLPIAAVVVLGDDGVAEAANAVSRPAFRPGRHAEMLALGRMPAALCLLPAQLTLYGTLEPCVMCFGAIVAHRLGRVVFGAGDPLSGATGRPRGLPEYVAAKARAIAWVGPALPEVCDPLRDRAIHRARVLRAALAAPVQGAQQVGMGRAGPATPRQAKGPACAGPFASPGREEAS